MNNTIKRTWNQGSLVNIEDLRGMTFQAESGGHTFVISAVDADGNAVAMSGTPAGTMLRPDNTDQALTCSISGGNVYATLPAGCYDVPGRAGITIFLTSGGQKTAIYAAVVSVTRTQSGTASPGTTASVVDLINAINTAISGIPATDTALKAAMAPTYSNSALYAVGDYAWYNGTLYRCTTAITTAETWTSGHWTTAAIGTDSANELRGLKSAIDNISLYGDNLFVSSTTTDGKRLANTGGEITDADYFSSDFVSVNPGFTYYKNSPIIDVKHRVCVYNSSKTFVSETSNNFVTIPSDGAYVRFSGKLTEKSSTVFALVSAVDSVLRNDYGTEAVRGKNVVITDATDAETYLDSDADNAEPNRIYHISDTAAAKAIDNLPIEEPGYLYTLSKANDYTDVMLQYYTSKVNLFRAFYRIKNQSGWQEEWVEFANTDHIDDVKNEAVMGKNVVIDSAASASTYLDSNADNADPNRIYHIGNTTAAKAIANLPIAEPGMLYTLSKAKTYTDVELQYYASKINLFRIFYRIKNIDGWNEWLEFTTSYKELFGEYKDTIEKSENCITEPALVFILVTDIHRYAPVTQTFNKMIVNMKTVADAIKCDFIMNLGDSIQGDAPVERSLMRAHEISRSFNGIGLPYLYANGNHDLNRYYNGINYCLDLNQTYSGFYQAVRNTARNMQENGTDYYIDFNDLKIRFIVLNSSNITVKESTGFTSLGYGNSTAEWLRNALDTNYNVILAEHVTSLTNQCYGGAGTVIINRDAITDVVSSFVENGGNLIQISGHLHMDLAFVDPWLSVIQVCQKFEKVNPTGSNYDAITGYIDGFGNPDRSADDFTEDAWSVCVYKPNSNEFDMIRFGAGIDRYFHVTPIAPTTVTTKLAGTITWSSSDTNVATVSDGVISGVGNGRCAILAKDENGNYECWIVVIAS